MPMISKFGNRWYDKVPQINQAMELLEKMPNEHRLSVARGVTQFTREHKLLGTTEELKNLGHEKVLGLIQSKVRRRWYDQDPTLHRAVNNILLMSEKNRQNVSFRLLVALESIETYTGQMQQEEKLVDPQEITQIVNDVFGRNLEDLVEMTDGTWLKRRAEEMANRQAEEDDNDSQVVDDDSGMKLSAVMGEGEEQP